MPLSYVVKRLTRSWQLYIALLLGILLATTFFAGVNVGADTAAKQALDQALENVPVDFYIPIYGVTSAKNATDVLERAKTIPEVKHAEIISRIYADAKLSGEEYYSHMFRLVGISQNSQTYQGWTDPPSGIAENTTYIIAGSSLAKLLKQGDTVQINMTTPTYVVGVPEPQMVSYALNLTVAGFAQLNNNAMALVQGQYSTYSFMGPRYLDVLRPPYEDLLIVDWQNTLAKLLDLFYESQMYYYDIGTDIIMHVDRNALISVWDITGSLSRLEALRRKIENQITIGGFGLTVQSGLQYVLTFAQMMLTMMRITFIAVSLPVFFVAWYMGTTVSDVSFNLRRREIGLLMTKGFSRSQLFRMFLAEALLIGIIAGVAGILLSIGLTPMFVRAVGGEFASSPIMGTDTMIMTVIFSITLVVLAVFRPARRASNLTTVDALREYMRIEDVKPYRKRWPWIAFILGAYKLIILALGINLINEVARLGMAGANFLLIILVGIWAIFDFYVLTYIGPVLFFWGFTKLFIRGSLKFQEITARLAKFLGDLGVLATRNVQRNPARAASVAFLIALIIGYGIQTTGTLASEQDYNTRQIYANVGSDIRIDLPPPVNVSATTDLMETVGSQVSGVASTTAEYSFYGSSSFGTLQLVAINTGDWRDTAYYEDGWFTGRDVATAFEQLSSNNHTIILDRDMAERYNLNIGDIIYGVNFGIGDRYSGSAAEDLTIAGFFGVRRPDYQIFGQISLYTSRSYVSQELFHELRAAVTNSSSSTILVKLTSGTNGTAAADRIRELASPGATVNSVSEQLLQQQSNLMYTGTLNVQRLGIAFAILAASIGTTLVTFVSLKERQREASMMGVRGLSFKQLTTMLLTENLAVVTFAVLLGAIAGLIMVYGNVASASSTVASLVSRRLVFPIDASLAILAYIGLVFASSILPVIIMSRRYLQRLEKAVR